MFRGVIPARVLLPMRAEAGPRRTKVEEPFVFEPRQTAGEVFHNRGKFPGRNSGMLCTCHQSFVASPDLETSNRCFLK